MKTEKERQLRAQLFGDLYGPRGTAALREIEELLGSVRSRSRQAALDRNDVWVIAYPDQITSPDQVPLSTLSTFTQRQLAPHINGVHTLPMHPSSSDAGFSVMDYYAVDPQHGSWDEIEDLATSSKWMADAVINHLSAQGEWFKSFLDGDPGWDDFFHPLDPETDTTVVTRPRESRLSTPFRSSNGDRVHLWATFSADQVDLNYRNPKVLVEITRVLLNYVNKGASAIRLDAVAFLWKDPDTSSINLPETHKIVQFLRACLDSVDPGVLLITETNVPHDENMSYLANGDTREAQGVYQFALPPLVLNTMLSGSAANLKRWLRELPELQGERFFLNFLASHDGIGVRPVERILSTTEVGELVTATKNAGGQVNYRELGNGSSKPYELAVSWFALMALGYSEQEAMKRHLAAHAICLVLPGIPLIYFNSLFAVGNDVDTFKQTGVPRDLNRQRSVQDSLLAELADPQSRPAQVWQGFQRLIEARKQSPAFCPTATLEVLDSLDETLVVRRTAPTGERAVVGINLSSQTVQLEIPGPKPTQLSLEAWDSAWIIEPVTMPQ